ALPDALAKDEIKPLSGAFDQSALSQNLGDTAITGTLSPKDVLRNNAGRKAARVDDFDPPRVLANEYRSSVAVIAVAHCIQDSFANYALVESRYIPNEEPLLKVLQIVA